MYAIVTHCHSNPLNGLAQTGRINCVNRALRNVQAKKGQNQPCGNKDSKRILSSKNKKKKERSTVLTTRSSELCPMS